MAKRFIILVPILLAVLGLQATSQEKIADAKPPSVHDAVTLALADCSQQTPFNQPFLRYIWVDECGSLPPFMPGSDGKQPEAYSTEEAAKAMSFAVNTISRANAIIRPVPIGKDNVLLLRVDLRHYAPRDRDIKEFVETWEDLQFDPRFSFILTAKTLELAVAAYPDWKGTAWVADWVPEPCEPYTKNGQTLTEILRLKTVKKTISLVDLKDIELVRISNPELVNLPALQHLTSSQAPIVTSGYFSVRSLSTIKDKGVYNTVYGGRYYHFAGIKSGAKKGTDEDVLLEDLGVGNVEKSITAAKIFDNLRSDQRVALFRSKVTGSPRRIDLFRTLTGRIDQASGLISFTHDLRTQDIDIDTHPIANLLDFKDAAREVIWERPNGLHGYALFDGKGKLQDEAPPDVAKDHTIPQPHTARLQPAIGCISCHEAEGSDGWKRVQNDVKSMLDSKIGLDIFTDISKKHANLADTLDRLAGLYQGDPEKALGRGRDDYASAVLRSTGPWRGSRRGQADAVQLTGTKIVAVWRGYFYDLVGPYQALHELGIACKREESLVLLREVLKPDLKSSAVGPDGQAIYLEDPRIAALRAGLEINRADWDLVFSFAYNRMLANTKALKK